MSLEQCIVELARRPASLQARAALAGQLEEMGVPVAGAVWASTVELAAARGQFFAALTLARRHLRGSLLDKTLNSIARRYGVTRSDGPRMPPPMPKAGEVELPADRSALVQMAVKLGRDTKALTPPANAGLPEVPLFSALSHRAFVALAKAFTEVPIAQGQALAEQGSSQPVMYLLGQGEAVVRQARTGGDVVELARVRAPALVGEMSLLTAVPRRASVIATTPGLAWRIDARTLEALGKQQPQLVRRLAELVKGRLLGNLMAQSELLQGVPDAQALLAAFRLHTVPAQSEIFAQGAPAPGLFLLLHGSAEVWASEGDSGDRTRVAVLTEGDAFGEMSLLSGDPTSAAVRMPEGGVLLHLPPGDFDALKGVLGGGLEALAEIRRGELSDLIDPVGEDFEQVDEAWLVD